MSSIHSAPSASSPFSFHSESTPPDNVELMLTAARHGCYYSALHLYTPSTPAGTRSLWESARRVRESFFMKVGVVGAGIFGVPAALELRSRGHDVTLFEQGTLPYEKASSTDVSKVIRRDGYGANETYLQLLRRATEQWREWQERLGETLYVQTGKWAANRTVRWAGTASPCPMA